MSGELGFPQARHESFWRRRRSRSQRSPRPAFRGASVVARFDGASPSTSALIVLAEEIRMLGEMGDAPPGVGRDLGRPGWGPVDLVT